MRALPTLMQNKLDQGISNLCRCWKITRLDGVVFAFTDHDQTLTVDGTSYNPREGAETSESASDLGFNVSGSEMLGALSSASLNESDLENGRFDSADVEIFLVDWSDPSQFYLLRKGTLGEVRLEGKAYTAEVRGLTHALNREGMRVFSRTCSAALGDGACSVNLNQSAFRATTTLAERDSNALRIGSLSSYANGWFTGGTAQKGEQKLEIVEDIVINAQRWLVLSDAKDCATGDTLTLFAGCDKRYETCREKFANRQNFRGFPHMPGDDFITRYASADDGPYDGASLIKG